MATSATITTPDNGITWFYKQQGTGPHIVLIPSGEGDCDAFDQVLPRLAAQFTVTTFDGPGMSRSVPVPPEALQDVSAERLAEQVLSLVDALGIEKPTFYGCSSGGATVLALAALHPERVRNAVVHEVPMLETIPYVGKVMSTTSTDEGALKNIGLHLAGDETAWDAMGPEYHARVLKNLPIWVAGYGHIPNFVSELVEDPSNLKKCPIDWTIGANSPAAWFFSNTKVAVRAGIPIGLLNSRHFPQITGPEELADHLVTTTKKYL